MVLVGFIVLVLTPRLQAVLQLQRRHVDHLQATGARGLGDGEPKIGAHGKPVLFLHPKDFNGTLVELEQV